MSASEMPAVVSTKIPGSNGLFIRRSTPCRGGLEHSFCRDALFSPKLTDNPRGEAMITHAKDSGIPALRCTEEVLSELTDTVQSQLWQA